MDQFGLCGEAEQLLDLARRFARDEAGLAAAVIGKASGDLQALEAPYGDHVAAAEFALHFDDADR
jgi:hypothetical protein